jgi:uncharacterized CHY-type Zn-finger protein
MSDSDSGSDDWTGRPHRAVGGERVRGVAVGSETRCGHDHTDRDVVAFRFPCCGPFYPCADCHAAVADHPAERWPEPRVDAEAVLCGACGSTMTVRAYLDSAFACPDCGAAFNPGCRSHYDRYFAFDP